MLRFFQALLIISVAIGTGRLFGQQRYLNMEDAVLQQRNRLWPETLRQFQWRPNTSMYSYMRLDDTLRIVESSSGKRVDALSIKALKHRFERLGVEAPYSWHGYTWINEHWLQLWFPEGEVLVSADGTQVEMGWRIPEGADNLHVSPRTVGAQAGRPDAPPQQEWLQYNIGQRIELINRKGGRRVVTADTAVGIVNGRAVHRNEFGCNDGIFWSPNGERLAFYRMDESMVAEYPLVEIGEGIAKAKPIRYPMAGKASHHVTMGIYSVADDRVVWLQTQGAADHYLTNPAWSPDGDFLYLAELNGGQDTMRLNCYDARTGAFCHELFRETSPQYVEPLHPLEFVPGGKGLFVWQSQRTGHNHLYLYQESGKLIRALTEGEWDVLDTHGFAPDGKHYFVTGNADNTIGRDLYRIELNSGKRTRLTNQKGYNQVVVDLAGNRFASFWTAFNNPGGVYIGSLDGGKIRKLLVARNPLSNYQMPGIRLVTLKAADGKTELYGRLITPPYMDESRRYPVVVYVYGGPHAQLVTDRWVGDARYWEILMAQRGYIVWVMDNRGSANRGFAFEQPIHRQLGEVEMADQMEGIKYLKSLRFTSSDRFGIHGWSFGGFMAMSLLLRQGNTFKVAVVGGPVTDWRLYEVMYGERYMDTPQENPDGYARADLRRYVKNLRGKRLLMIHGYIDETVVLQHQLQFLNACIAEGQYEVDTFIYPSHPHNVRGRDRVHLMNKVTDYFEEYL